MRSAVVITSVFTLAAAGVAAPGVARAQESYDAVDVQLTRVVGLIEIETGGVDRVSVDHDPGDDLVDAPDFEVRDNELRITQLPRHADISCRSRGQGLEMEVGRGGYHPIEDYGRFVIRVPEGAKVEIEEGGVTGTIGDVGELELGLNSCGDITAGEVAGDAEIAVNGSGDVRVGAVGGAAEVAVNGSGDVAIGPVANGLEAAINGSGEVEIASVEGEIEAAIRGSGDVTIGGGHATSIEAAIMGSGDVRFEGVADNVELSSFGSGDVYVAEVTGEVNTAAFGSGQVHVGRD
jgi:hypothetical protein